VALSEAQKAQVRLYLGFDRGRDLHPALESRWAWLSAEEEALVTGTLAALGGLDTKLLSAALENLDASKVDEVTLLGPEQLRALRAQGRMLVRRLGAVFAVEPLRDYFDDGGASMGGLFAVG